MRSFKVIVCFIINFVLIFFFSFFLKFGNPLYLQQKEAKNISDLDTLIVGTSNGRLGIDPKILNEKLVGILTVFLQEILLFLIFFIL